MNPEGILTGGPVRRVRFTEPPSPPRRDPSTQQSPPTYLAAIEEHYTRHLTEEHYTRHLTECEIVTIARALGKVLKPEGP